MCRRIHRLLLTVVGVLALGCDPQSEQDAAEDALALAPLQPLIYTEVPDLTPEAAGVRERRLVRQLYGARKVAQTPAALAMLRPPEDATQLGQQLLYALYTRQEGLWDLAFVSPRAYHRLVNVSHEAARDFVDELQGRSLPTWNLFAIERPSEAPAGGMGSIFAFQELVLGQGRKLDGKLAKDNEPVSQYWGNTLKLRLNQADVSFEIHIPKIVRVVDRPRFGINRPVLAIASKISSSHSLNMFIAAGFHLKPELLRPQDYPYPLAVGNFWRYRRFTEAPAAVAKDSPKVTSPIEPDEAMSELVNQADEVILEILHVERYQSRRLVKYQRSYNDPDLVKKSGYWLMTPRALFPCSRGCVNHIEDLPWLLNYLQKSTPYYLFPLPPGKRWGVGGQALDRQDIDRILSSRAKRAKKEARRRKKRRQKGALDPNNYTPFRPLPMPPGQHVAAQPVDVQVPAGLFLSTLTVTSDHVSSPGDPFVRLQSLERSFAPSQGVVRRRVTGLSGSGKSKVIVEELVESRIIGR